MDYVGRIFRPPSEAASFLLQVTIGCSHNSCVYCDMYRDKQFRPKPFDTILADIAEAAALGPRFKRVFLCDGDALILSTKKLLPILEAITTKLPWVERVGTYGDTRSVGRKSIDELAALREAGLGIVYHGMESGDDAVLERIDKGGTRTQAIQSAAKLREAGIAHSVMVLLGVGGMTLSEQHAENTAITLSEMDPSYVGALTTTVVPGTPLAKMQAEGAFELPSKFRMLEELRAIVAGVELTHCRFSANHASNYLPVRCTLPRDKAAVLEALDGVLAARDERMLKPESLRAL
ncbi:MAG: radical SAM protein [Myxococcota bacterium]